MTPGPQQAQFERAVKALLKNDNFIRAWKNRSESRTRGAARSAIGSELWTYHSIQCASMEMKEDIRCYLNRLLNVDQKVGSPSTSLPELYLPRHTFIADDVSAPTPAPTLTKETTMYIITITNQTLVNGTEIGTMSDSQLFSLIAKQEQEIEAMRKIQAKPKRLVVAIEARQKAIDDLVKLIDERDGAQ